MAAHDLPGAGHHNIQGGHTSASEPTRLDRPGVQKHQPGQHDRPTLSMADLAKFDAARQKVREASASAGFGIGDTDANGIWENPGGKSDASDKEPEYRDAEFFDPLASGRTVKEFAALISNLDERLDGENQDQLRLILGEIGPHLALLRPEQVNQILEVCPLLLDVDQFLVSLEQTYSKQKEVLPGLTEFQAAVRELGSALTCIFKNMAFSLGIEKLRALAEGKYSYTFIDFRDSLLRNDYEAPRFSQELTFWFMKLTIREKQIITKNWRIPPTPEKITKHLCAVYPERYHTYILQIFAEKLRSLFAHSTIPDDAKPSGHIEGPAYMQIATEANHLSVIWSGNLPLPAELPEEPVGRVTDRILHPSSD